MCHYGNACMIADFRLLIWVPKFANYSIDNYYGFSIFVWLRMSLIRILMNLRHCPSLFVSQLVALKFPQ